MGRESHQIYKQFKEEERRAKRYGHEHVYKAEILKLQYEAKDREEKEDFERSLKLFKNLDD